MTALYRPLPYTPPSYSLNVGTQIAPGPTSPGTGTASSQRPKQYLDPLRTSPLSRAPTQAQQVEEIQQQEAVQQQQVAADTQQEERDVQGLSAEYQTMLMQGVYDD